MHLQKSYAPWQIVFGILASTYIFGAIVYLIFGSGELQHWNNPPEKKKPGEKDEEEGLPLQDK